jgi:cholesterol transport system auxiliary component
VKRRLALLSVIGALLQGCALVPGGGPPPLDTYELSAADTGEGGVRRGGVQVLVTEPSALKSLDGQNIVVKPEPGVVQYLKGAQWADRLPKVVQARLAETLQKTGRLGGVGKPGEGLAIDYQIIAEIRAFEIRLDGNSRAYVDLFVRLLNDRNGTVRAAREFDATAVVAGDGNDAFVSALDRAFGEAAAAIADWAIGQM